MILGEMTRIEVEVKVIKCPGIERHWELLPSSIASI